MRFMIFAAAAAMPFVAAEASAASWYRVVAGDQTVSYVDLDSIRMVDGKTIAITQSVYAAPVDKDVWASAIRSEYDCAARSYRRLEYTYYGKGGTLIGTEPAANLSEHKVPPPGSLSDTLMGFVCFNGTGIAVADPFADARSQFVSG